MVSENIDSTRSDAGSGDGRTRVSWDEFLQPSTAVAEAVAAATDRDPTELEPIHESIDTDALDSLVSSADAGRTGAVRLSFSHEDVEVFVDTRRGIEVEPAAGDDVAE